MSARATTIAQGFSQKLLKEMYDRSLTDVIVNRDYQGEINDVGSKLNILNFDRITEKTYTGADLGTPDSLTENNTVLTIDQYKSFYWKEKTLDNWLSYIKNPHPTIVAQKADERNKNMDEFVLGLYGDVGAGNRVGTNADDATTITITVTTGAFVVSGGTPVDSTWVGKGIKAVGHSKWYRVASVSSTTEGVIVDDLDDVTQYTGGAISGASYVVEAISAVSVTTSNILNKVALLKQKLDLAESFGLNSVPDSDRVLIVPPEFETTLVQGTGIALHVPAVYEELVKRGFITELLGFKVFKSNRLTGDNTNGYHILALHPNWCTFAEKLLAADITEDLIQNFGSAYKDLFVYGAKVADPRRHFAAELFATFA